MQEAPEEKERRDVLLNMYKGLNIFKIVINTQNNITTSTQV